MSPSLASYPRQNEIPRPSSSLEAPSGKLNSSFNTKIWLLAIAARYITILQKLVQENRKNYVRQNIRGENAAINRLRLTVINAAIDRLRLTVINAAINRLRLTVINAAINRLRLTVINAAINRLRLTVINAAINRLRLTVIC